MFSYNYVAVRFERQTYLIDQPFWISDVMQTRDEHDDVKSVWTDTEFFTIEYYIFRFFLKVFAIRVEHR